MVKQAVITVWCALLVAGTADAAEPAKPFTPDWESLKRHEAAPRWFRDAKFGIYFHWGVYSVPAFGSEWYPRHMHLKKRREHKHHLETYGDPAKFGYHDFVPRFKAEKFDAEAWAALFEKAGARFAGPVAEHHDGFAMWASKLTPWNVGDVGPKRDITGELARAIRKRGMRFVVTFHHARNQGHYPRVEGWPTTSSDPRLQMLYGNMPREKFLDLWLGKLKEVIDNYQPDLMWFDSWLNDIPDSHKTAYLAYYFNKAAAWGRDVVVTRKQRDLPLELSVEDFEKGRMNQITEHTWLTDDTISLGSWCYTESLRIKPTRQVLHVLSDIVSKNGCLLLNISPKADGTIPDNQRQVLLDLGAWLAKFGEAIYGTGPWVVFGEGPTRLKRGGGFTHRHGGYLKYTARDIRFTTRGDVLYAIFLGAPKGTATIASLAKGSGLFGGEPTRVTLLGSEGKLHYTHDAKGLHVAFPPAAPDEHAVALKIEGLKVVGFKPDRSVRFQAGKAVLDASQAGLHGPTIALESKDGGKSSIGFWDDPSAWVSWEVTFPAAGSYEVHGRFAARRQSAVEVVVGGEKLRGRPPVTGDWGKFESVRLGTIEVAKPGRQEVKLVAVREGWAAVNLSRLELRKAR